MVKRYNMHMPNAWKHAKCMKINCRTVTFLSLIKTVFNIGGWPEILKTSTTPVQVFWDPWPWLEGSYELGSLCLSFCSSVLPCRSFLGIGSLVFSETQHSVRRPCVVVRSKAIFLKKVFLPPKLGKWAKIRVFLIYWKN